LVNGLVEAPILQRRSPPRNKRKPKFIIAPRFGLAGAVLGVDEESTLLA